MLVKGKECPVVGKVCMDMTLIDITGVDAKEEDDVIIYNSEMKLYRISKWIGKIPYELLTAISKRVQRIYIRD
jgi:alanine racemase